MRTETWWPHGTSASRASRGAFKHTSQTVYWVNLLRISSRRLRSRLYSAHLCAAVTFESVSTRCAQSIQSETHFWNLRFPYFSDSRVFHSRVFHPCSLVLRFPLPRFPPLQSGAAFSTPAFSTPAVWCRVFHSCVFHSRVFSAPVQSSISQPRYLSWYRYCFPMICSRLIKISCRLFHLTEQFGGCVGPKLGLGLYNILSHILVMSYICE